MINFTVGPVQSSNEILSIGSEQVPYFRTEEFSNIMFENEKLIKKFSKADDKSKAVFMTGSGTLSMEVAVINTLTKDDKILIINGGSFSKRFIEICQIHELNFDSIDLNIGKQLKKEQLNKYINKGYTSLLVNMHETSTGVCYDMELIADFCKQNNIFLIVDAISAFLADEIKMKKWGIDVLIVSSQKALACPPGISAIILSEKALFKIQNNKQKTLYLDLKSALKDQERGQTPFTPAVSILLQINKRLKSIEKNGGEDIEILRVKNLANDFRCKIKNMPFEFVSESKSNAVTAIRVKNCNAYEIFKILKDEYSIWICPNGGELKNTIFRVGHIGFLTKEDNDKLIESLESLIKRGILK